MIKTAEKALYDKNNRSHHMPSKTASSVTLKGICKVYVVYKLFIVFFGFCFPSNGIYVRCSKLSIFPFIHDLMTILS